MKILIIAEPGRDRSLCIGLNTLWRLRGERGEIKARSNLNDATLLIDWVDGIICAQQTTNDTTWAGIALRCYKTGKPLVLLLRDAALTRGINVAAREHGLDKWPAFALLEPVHPEFVAETIVAATAGRHAAAAGQEGSAAAGRIGTPKDRRNEDGKLQPKAL